MEISKSFAIVLREIRIQKSFTIKELAEKSKLSERHVINLENGKHLPTIDKFFRISFALGVDPQHFINKLDMLIRP